MARAQLVSSVDGCCAILRAMMMIIFRRQTKEAEGKRIALSGQSKRSLVPHHSHSIQRCLRCAALLINRIPMYTAHIGGHQHW